MGKKQRKRNIKFQMNNAIDSRFMKGRSKHQDKKNGTKHDVIYMVNEYNHLKEMVDNLGGFIKKEYPEYHREQLDKIPVEVYDAFLETKKHCSQNTIAAYQGRIEKIFRCCGATYKTGDFEQYQYLNTPLSDRDPNSTLRDVAVDPFLIEKALEYMGKDSGGYRGNKIASMFGLRSKELELAKVQDVNFEEMTFTVPKGKGGRRRVIKMTPSQANEMKKLVKDKKPGQRIAGVGTDAIQKSFLRAIERIDKEYGTNYAEELKDKKTNTHAIRKAVATREYNKNLIKEKNQALYKYMLSDEKLRRLGKEKIINYIKHYREGLIDKYGINRRELEHKAWGPVSEMLGHGKGRWELKKVYVISDSTKIIGSGFKNLI